MRPQAIAMELKPLRLNFAQYCIQCGDRWCESPDCVARHERSRWMLCDRCNGTMEDPTGCNCGCLFGLVEDWPAPGDRGDPSADQATMVAAG